MSTHVHSLCYRSDLNLAQRMEYLSRATMCAKSSTQRISATTEGKYLHELEEKMEVKLTVISIHGLKGGVKDVIHLVE